MDPNATLKELRERLTDMVNSPDYKDCPEVWEVFERFDALDAWLCKGGFKPAAWERKS